MTEIIEMAQVLLEMSGDKYMQCKYILLSVSRGQSGTNDFIKKLFRLTDRC